MSYNRLYKTTGQKDSSENKTIQATPSHKTKTQTRTKQKHEPTKLGGQQNCIYRCDDAKV